MNKIVITIGVLALGVAFVVWQATSKKESIDIGKTIGQVQSSNCSEEASRSELFSKSSSSYVRSLGEIENKCNSKVTDTIKYTITIPSDDYTSKLIGLKASEDLRSLTESDLKPIIFLDISKDWIEADFNNLESGKLDIYISSLIKSLKISGINENNISAFIVLPKPNLPTWNNKNISPNKYYIYANKLIAITRETYPSVPIGLYFNSSTYEATPFSYEGKEYQSLLPYLENIDKTNVSILGIEGLPWTPKMQSGGESIFDPSEYLGLNSLIEAAEYLNTNQLIIGTGSFAAMYTNDVTSTVPIPADVRKDLLDKTLEAITPLKTRNFDVRLMLNSYEDLSGDGIDWGYYGSLHTEKPLHEKVLLDFLRNLNQKKVGLIMNYN